MSARRRHGLLLAGLLLAGLLLAGLLLVSPTLAHAQDTPDAPPPVEEGGGGGGGVLEGGIIEGAMKGALRSVVDEVAATLRSWAFTLVDTLTGGWLGALQTLASYNLITQIPLAWLTDNAVVRRAMDAARDLAWRGVTPALTVAIALLFIGPFLGGLYRSALSLLGNLGLTVLALASTAALWAGGLTLINALIAALVEATTGGSFVDLRMPPNLAAPVMAAWLFLWTLLYIARLVLLVRLAIRCVGHLLSAMLIPLCGPGPWLAWGKAGLGEALTPVLQCLAMALGAGFLATISGSSLTLLEPLLGIAALIAALTAHKMLPGAMPGSGLSPRALTGLVQQAARLAPTPVAPAVRAAEAGASAATGAVGAWSASVVGRATVRAAPTVWREIGPGASLQRLPSSPSARAPLALPKP